MVMMIMGTLSIPIMSPTMRMTTRTSVGRRRQPRTSILSRMTNSKKKTMSLLTKTKTKTPRRRWKKPIEKKRMWLKVATMTKGSRSLGLNAVRRRRDQPRRRRRRLKTWRKRLALKRHQKLPSVRRRPRLRVRSLISTRTRIIHHSARFYAFVRNSWTRRIAKTTPPLPLSRLDVAERCTCMRKMTRTKSTSSSSARAYAVTIH
mmetsp:Transcript_5035/g.18271  ORF Transcript_5035/g.18271 Transcript_5035/m.18271 type:complete len:204 (-) Transcript_5035:52-663(-)